MAPPQASSPWSWFGWFGRSQPAGQPSQNAGPPSRPIKHAHLTVASDDDSFSSQEDLGARTQPITEDEAAHYRGQGTQPITGDEVPDGGPASQHTSASPKTAAGGRNILTSWAPAINPAQKKAEIVWLDEESYPPLPPPPNEPLPFDPTLMLTPPHTPPKAQSPLSSCRKSTNMPAVGGLLNSGRKSSNMPEVAVGAKDGSNEGMQEIQAAPQPPPSPLCMSEASFAFPGGPDASGASVSSPSPMNTPHLSITNPSATAHASLSSQRIAHAGDINATSMPKAAHSPAFTPAPPSSPPMVPSAAPDRAYFGDAAKQPATTPTNIPPASDGVAAAVVLSTHHPPNAEAPLSGPHPTQPINAPPATFPSPAKGALLFAAPSFATVSPKTQDKWGSAKWAWNEGKKVGGPPISQAPPPHLPTSRPTGVNSSSGSGESHAALQAHNPQLSPFDSSRVSAHQLGTAAHDPGPLQQRPATSGSVLGGGIRGGDLASAVSLDGGLSGPDAAKVELRDVSGREAWANLAPRPRSSGSRAQGGGSQRLSGGSKRGSKSSSSSGGGSGGEGRTTHENMGQTAHVKRADTGSPVQATTGSSSGVLQMQQAAEPGHAGRASITSGSAAQVGSKDARSEVPMGGKNAHSAAHMQSKIARVSSDSAVGALLGSKDGSTQNFSSVPGSCLSSCAGSWKEGRASCDDVSALARRRTAFQTKHRVSRFSDPGSGAYPSTPLLGSTEDILALERGRTRGGDSAATSAASHSGLLLRENSASYSAGFFKVGGAGGNVGMREVQPSSSGSLDRGKGGGWTLNTQESSMGKHSDDMQRSSITKRSVKFRCSSDDGSPYNLLPGATGFAPAQGNGLGVKPGVPEDAATRAESTAGTGLQPSSRIPTSFPSRLARVTQRLMPMLTGGSKDEQGEQMDREDRDGSRDLDPENLSANHHGMPQRTGSALFGGVLGVLRSGSTTLQAPKPLNWAQRAKLLMKSQSGSLSHHLSENGSFGEDTSPSDSKGGTSKGGRSHRSNANHILKRVASSIGKSFNSSNRFKGMLGLDSDDSDSEDGGSLKQSRPQILPYSSFNDAANRALLGSARKGDLHGVKEALDQNADPNLEDNLVTPEATNMGMTPLHYIAACGRQYTWEPPTCSDSVAANITCLLLQHGARKHPKDRMGFLPLHLAAYHGSMGVLQQLLEGVETKRDILGCSINCQDCQVRYTPLHCAVEGQQPEAVVALLQRGASCTIKDYTSFTPWNLAATFMSSFAFSLIAQLNIALAQDSRVPADAVMRLALEMRYLEAVPVVLRATAKCPQQVWALMRTTIASGLQEFAELLAEDIPTVCPRALLQVPWGDVMVELATRFPECFKILIHGLDYVDFESIVLPFIQGLNFDADPVTQEVPDAPALPPSSPPRSPGPSFRPNIAKLLSNKSGRSSKLNRVKPEADTPAMSPSMNLSMYAVGGGLDNLRSNTMDRSFSHVDSQHKVGCGKGLWSTLLCRADDEDVDDGFEEAEHAEDKRGIMSLLTRSSRATTSVPDKQPSAKAASLWRRASAATSAAASEQRPRLGAHGRAKSAVSLKSMLVLGNQDEFKNGSASSGPAAPRGPLPEALKYLLLRCLVSSLDRLSWKVWQALVGGLHGGLALEIAHFPKLFKRLAESIAERSVPDWRDVGESDRIKRQQREGNDDASSNSLSEHRLTDDFSAKYEQHMTLNLNHLVSAAIASRSGLNVYNIVMAMDRWLALNPTCYLGRLDPWVIGAMAAHYPDACRLLLSMEFQDQCAIKVPGHLVGSSAAPVFRCSFFSQAFVWQEDGLVVLVQAGLDLKRVERWVIHGISFYAILKLFKASAYRYPSAITASFLEKLLEAGLPGQDITKLIQLDTDLNDVVAALKGGLSAHFIHHMVSRRISFQVVTEMLGATLDKSTEWMNVRHQPVWKKFPSETWRYGITYTFIRIFFETWEDYRFDKRFIDLMFDFHDPLFVKLRTALEYVNSNKALQVSLSQEEADISLARRTRLFGSVGVVCRAFKEQRIYVHRVVIAWMATLVTYVYLWAVEDFRPTIKAAQQANIQGIEPKQKDGATQKLTDASELDTPFDKQEASGNMLRNGGLTESPKVDAISETLPMIDVAKTGRECYLRALLAADAPASMFGLPVVKGIINVKWISYGWRYMALLLAEHLLFMALVITYLILIIHENQVCVDNHEGDGSTVISAGGRLAADFTVHPAAQDDLGARFESGTIISLRELANCSTGIATLVLDALMSWMCALGSLNYLSQLRRCGFVLWVLQADNWSDILTIMLNAAMLGCHIGRKHVSLLSLVSVQVLLQFLRLGSYAMMIERLGSLVRIIGQIFKDTLYFLFLLLMLYVGFALAFFVLAPPSTPPGSLALKLFTIMLGDVNASFFEDEVLEEFATPWLSVLLMIAYTIMLLIVLFNMLVAIMNDTFNRIRTEEHDEVLRGKAVQLVGIEASLSSEQQENLSRLLLGKFLHVLRPTCLDKDGSGNGGAGGAGKGASDTAIAVRDAVRGETAAIKEEMRQMLASIQPSHRQPRSWGSHSSPPLNTASRVGTRTQSRAVSKAPSRAVSRPTSAFPRFGAPVQPKPAIKQPHFSSQAMGSNKGSKASGPFLAPGDSAYPSRAPSEMVSRAASIPASRVSSARSSLDEPGKSLSAGGNHALNTPQSNQGMEQWNDLHSPHAPNSSGMGAQAASGSRSMGASVSLHRDRHPALLVRPKSSFRQASSFQEPPSVAKAAALFSGAGAGSRHVRLPATGSFTKPFEPAAPAAQAEDEKAALPLTAATRAAQARHAAQFSIAVAPPSQSAPHEPALHTTHSEGQRTGSIGTHFEPRPSFKAKKGDDGVQRRGSDAQSNRSRGRAPSQEAGQSSSSSSSQADRGTTEATGRVDSSGGQAEPSVQKDGCKHKSTAETGAVAQYPSLEQQPAASGHEGTEQALAATGYAGSRPLPGKDAHTPSPQDQGLTAPPHDAQPANEPARESAKVGVVQGSAPGEEHSADAGASSPSSTADAPQKQNSADASAAPPPPPARPAARGPAVRFRSIKTDQSSSEDGGSNGKDSGSAAHPQPQSQHVQMKGKRVSLEIPGDDGRGTGITFQPSRLASRAASRQPSRPGSAMRVGFMVHGTGRGDREDRRVSDAGSWRAGSLNSSHQGTKEHETIIPHRERASPPGGLGVHFTGRLHANAYFGDGEDTEDGGDDRGSGSGGLMQENALYQENVDNGGRGGLMAEDDEEVEIDEDYGESEEEEEESQDHSSGSSASGSSSSSGSSSLVEDDRHTLASHSILTSRTHSSINQAYGHRYPAPHSHLPLAPSRRPFSSSTSSSRPPHSKGHSHSHQRHNPHDHPLPKLFSRAPSPPSGYAAGSHGHAKDHYTKAAGPSRAQPSSEAAASVAAAMARVNDRRRPTMNTGHGLLTPAEALKEAHGDPDSEEDSFFDDLDAGHRAPAPAGVHSRRQTFSQGLASSRRQTASQGFGGRTPRVRHRRSTHADTAAKLTVQEDSDAEAEGGGAAVEQPVAPAVNLSSFQASRQASRRMRPSGRLVGPSRPSSSRMSGVPEAVSHQPTSMRATRTSGNGAPHRHTLQSRVLPTGGLGSQYVLGAGRAVEEEGGSSAANSLAGDDAEPAVKPPKLASMRESMGSFRDRELVLPFLTEEPQLRRSSSRRVNRLGISDSPRYATLDDKRESRGRGSGRFQEGPRASGVSFEEGLHESSEEEEDAVMAKRRRGRSRSRGAKVDAEIRAAAEMVVMKATVLSDAALSSRGPGRPSGPRQQPQLATTEPAAAVPVEVARPYQGPGPKASQQVQQQTPGYELGHFPTSKTLIPTNSSSRANTPGNLSVFNTSAANTATNFCIGPPGTLGEGVDISETQAPIEIFQEEPHRVASGSVNTSGNLFSNLPTNPFNSLRTSLNPAAHVPSRNSRSSRPSVMSASGAVFLGDAPGGMSAAQESGDDGPQTVSFESSPSSRSLRALAAASPQGDRLAYSRERALQAPTPLTAPVPEDAAIHGGGHKAEASDSGQD